MSVTKESTQQKPDEVTSNREVVIPASQEIKHNNQTYQISFSRPEEGITHAPTLAQIYREASGIETPAENISVKIKKVAEKAGEKAIAILENENQEILGFSALVPKRNTEREYVLIQASKDEVDPELQKEHLRARLSTLNPGEKVTVSVRGKGKGELTQIYQELGFKISQEITNEEKENLITLTYEVPSNEFSKISIDQIISEASTGSDEVAKPETIENFKQSKFYQELQKLPEDERLKFENDLYKEIILTLKVLLKDELDLSNEENAQKLFKLVVFNFIPDYTEFENINEAKEKIMVYYAYLAEGKHSLGPQLDVLNEIPIETLKFICDSDADTNTHDLTIKTLGNEKFDGEINNSISENLIYLFKNIDKDLMYNFSLENIPNIFEILSKGSPEVRTKIIDEILEITNSSQFSRLNSILIQNENNTSSERDVYQDLIEKINNIKKLNQYILENNTGDEEKKNNYIRTLSTIFSSLKLRSKEENFTFSLNEEILTSIKDFDLNTNIYGKYWSEVPLKLIDLIKNEEDLNLFLTRVIKSNRIQNLFVNDTPEIKNINLNMLVNLSESSYVQAYQTESLNLADIELKAKFYQPLLDKGFEINIVAMMFDYLQIEDLENIDNISKDEILKKVINERISKYNITHYDKTLSLIESFNIHSKSFTNTFNEQEMKSFDLFRSQLTLKAFLDNQPQIIADAFNDTYGKYIRNYDFEEIKSFISVWSIGGGVILSRERNKLIEKEKNGINTEEQLKEFITNIKNVDLISKLIDRNTPTGERLIIILTDTGILKDISEDLKKGGELKLEYLLLKGLPLLNDTYLKENLILTSIRLVEDFDALEELIKTDVSYYASTFINSSLEVFRYNARGINFTNKDLKNLAKLYEVLNRLNLDPELKKEIFFNTSKWDIDLNEEVQEINEKFFSDIIQGSLYAAYKLVDKIPSSDLREIAKEEVKKYIRNLSFNRTISKEEFYSFLSDREKLAIPKEMILVFEAIFHNEPDKIENFNKIYSKNIGFNTRETINNFIINSIKYNDPSIQNIFDKAFSKVSENLDTLNKENSALLSKVCSFLITLHMVPGDLTNLENRVTNWDGKDYNEFLEIFKSHIASSLPELFNDLLEIKAILNFETLYQSFDVPIVYRGERDVDIEYFAQILNSISAEDIQKWKEFKYRKLETNQLYSKMTEEQKDRWRRNTWMLNRNSEIKKYVNSSRIIYENLISAVENQTPIAPLTRNEEIVHQTVIDALKNVPEFNTDAYFEFMNANIARIQAELDLLNTCLDKKTLVTDLEFNINKYKRGQQIKVENIQSDLERLSRYLNLDEINELRVLLSSINQNSIKTCKAEDIIPDHIFIKLQQTLNENITKVNEANKAVFASYGINPENKDFIRSVREVRENLLIPFYIFKLSMLTPELIIDNQLSRDRGEKLDEVIEKIKKYFEYTGLDGIVKDIKEKAQEGENENVELMMILTDSPFLSLVLGKYPLASGSCQNYENGSVRRTLLAYVGDSHCKVLYGLDTKKLPKELIDLIRTQGIDNIDFEKHATEVLNAIVARSVIKLGVSGSIEPVVYIEPVYTSSNKSNHSMDQAIFEFMNEMFDKESGFTISSGNSFIGGNPSAGIQMTISIQESENKPGQYEDSQGQGASQGEYTLSGNKLN